jgi:hypothetical protein
LAKESAWVIEKGERERERERALTEEFDPAFITYQFGRDKKEHVRRPQKQAGAIKASG